MPIEYPGGGVVAEHTAVRDVGRRLRRLAPRQGRRLGAGRRRLRQRLPHQRPAPHRARARRSTRCAAPRPAASSTTSSTTCAATTTSSSSPTPPTPPRWSSCSQAAAPDGIDGREPPRQLRRHRRAGDQERRGARGARPARRPRLHVASSRPTGRGSRSSSAAPGTPASAATSSCPPGRSSAPLWDALLGPPAEHGGLPCGLGARDTLRTEMGYPLHGNDLVARHHPGAGARRLGRRLEEGRVLGQGRARRREGRGPEARGLGPARDRPRHPALALRGQVRRRGGARRGHLGHLLADAEAGHRPGPARAGRGRGRRRSSSTCAAARCRRVWCARRSWRSASARPDPTRYAGSSPERPFSPVGGGA